MTPWNGFRGAAVICAALFVTPAGAESGKASWYGGGEKLSAHTASGQRFVPDALTCARPSFRAGHKPYRVRVTHLKTGRSVVCLVNDRGPAAHTGKVIDLSRGSARALGMGPGKAGTASVQITVIK